MRTWAVVTAVLLALLVGGGAAAAGTLGGQPMPGSSWAPPADGSAGPVDVALSPQAARHPRGPWVAVQLRTHYVAINQRDYEGWRRTVVAERIAALPEDAFRNAYASTEDGSILVERISTRPDGSLAVRVRFVSVQAPPDAPADLQVPRICWRSTLPMVELPPPAGPQPRITDTADGSSIAEEC